MTAPPRSEGPGGEGLHRQLSAGQQAMMAVGGAIGTGLFLGSGLTVAAAGPAVVFSYLLAAVISSLLCAGLTELAVAHPAAGSFGLYADRYVSPFAGYAVRVSYWLMQVIATGGHLVAIATYLRFWFPEVPAFVWVVGFGAGLAWLNTREVGAFGTVEYWFAMIKVVAIGLFVALAVGLLIGVVGDQSPGLTNYTAHGGFAPNGFSGIWIGAVFAIYSFIGVEIVAVTSGEARDPARTIPVAMGRMVLGLSLLYSTTVLLVVGVASWRELGVGQSPFVTVLASAGVPVAAGVMNFVVLTAALSSANANLYLCSRMLFSLAQGGYVPASLGRLGSQGVPARAAVVSSLGFGLAVVLQAAWGNTAAYTWFFGVALFGAMFVWVMIFVTHLRFRAARPGDSMPVRVPLSRAMSWLGLVLVLAVIVSTGWIPALRVTMLVAVPWLCLLALGYHWRRWASRPRTPPRRTSP
ncbi:MAG: amino acid permease [Gemmatimonadales bacterium]